MGAAVLSTELMRLLVPRLLSVLRSLPDSAFLPLYRQPWSYKLHHYCVLIFCNGGDHEKVRLSEPHMCGERILGHCLCAGLS